MPFLYVDFNQVKSIIKKKTLEQINHTILFPRVQKQLLVTTSMRNLKKNDGKKIKNDNNKTIITQKRTEFLKLG